MTNKPKGKIVEAVGTAGGADFNPSLIQDAMTQAAADAQAEGITDPDEIRERKLAARERVKEMVRAAAKPPAEE